LTELHLLPQTMERQGIADWYASNQGLLGCGILTRLAGASVLIGVVAIEAFLSSGWEVVGISRRKPSLPSGRDFAFISVDLLTNALLVRRYLR
jgi:hypothetical protein